MHEYIKPPKSTGTTSQARNNKYTFGAPNHSSSSSSDNSSRIANSSGLKMPKRSSEIEEVLFIPKTAASKRKGTDSAQLNFPNKRPHTTTNPFKAKDQGRSTFNSSHTNKPFIANDDDDFQPTAPVVAEFNLPKRSSATNNTNASLKQTADDSDDSKDARDETDKQKKEIMPTTILKNLRDAEIEMKENKDKVQCPFCTVVLEPLTQPLKRALKKLKRRDEEYEARQKNENSSAFTPFNFVIKRPVGSEEKDEFCKLHKTECVVKPKGLKNGYPTTIDFYALPPRVRNFRQELEAVIKNKLKSDYRDLAEEAYKELGVSKARSTMSVMTRFEATLPGYYGPQGAAVILDTLTDMFLKSGYLSKHLVSRQLPLEFCQQVLVPEVGFRLIREDLQKQRKTARPIENATEKAKQIMRESCEYGNLLFPTENQHIEGGDEESLRKSEYVGTIDDVDEDDDENRDDYL